MGAGSGDNGGKDDGSTLNIGAVCDVLEGTIPGDTLVDMVGDTAGAMGVI